MVYGNMANKVHIIIKEKTSSPKGDVWERDMMYDREYFITQDRIVVKTYDAKTDKFLAEQ